LPPVRAGSGWMRRKGKGLEVVLLLLHSFGVHPCPTHQPLHGGAQQRIPCPPSSPHTPPPPSMRSAGRVLKSPAPGRLRVFERARPHHCCPSRADQATDVRGCQAHEWYRSRGGEPHRFGVCVSIHIVGYLDQRLLIPPPAPARCLCCLLSFCCQVQVDVMQAQVLHPCDWRALPPHPSPLPPRPSPLPPTPHPAFLHFYSALAVPLLSPSARFCAPTK
jgi:hypothetical protein